MEIVIIILLSIILLVGIFGILLIFNQKNKNQQSPVNIELLQKDIENSKNMLELQVQNLTNQLDDFKKSWNGSDVEKGEKLVGLITNIDNFQKALDKKEDDYKRSANLIQNQVTNVITNLTELKESSNVLLKINDNIQGLQDIFVNTKKRGNVGEYLLEKILTNMLGANSKIWKRQYKTHDDNIVDAYIKTSEAKEGIAIDSKFPLDNYKKYLESEDTKVKNEYLKVFRNDIRKKIDESAKYISIKNQISSVIMFIPSEEIFTFIYGHYSEDIVEYAFKKHVWITSPTTLAAILFTVESHMKEIAFNQNIEKIREQLLKIKDDFDRWIERWGKFKAGFKLTNKAIDDLDKTHEKLSKHYQKILKNPDEIKESE